VLTEFKLPGLGENIKSGIATKIMVKVGDSIGADQPVLELETDKAVLEIPASIGGVVKEILVKQGQEVKIGQLILKIEAGAAALKESPAPVKTAAPVSEAKKETVKIPEPFLAAREEKISTPQPSAHKVEPATEKPKDVAAAPSVRRFAREIGIDIARVPGSGPGGRISLDDVKAFSKRINTELQSGPGIESVSLPDFSKWGSVERVSTSMLRRKAAEHLSYAWRTIPHVTQFDKADITDLESLRKRYAKKVEEKGGKLTITPFILKVIASALKTFPKFNSSIDMARNEIIQKKYYSVGIAVDTDRGLLVPVIRDIDKKSLIEISIELTQMAERARNKKTSIEEMQGGTFTITNLGSIGGTYFTPIVNSPEVAILGISRAALEPCYASGAVCAPRLMLPLSLSYDHRVIDGADGARFLRFIVEAIEQPLMMQLEE